MSRRRLVLIGLLFLPLATGGFALWLFFAPPASAINRANALKIKPGMTLAEVEAILGGPARDEARLTLTGWTMSVTHNSASLVDDQGRSYSMQNRGDGYFKVQVGRFSDVQTQDLWRNRRSQIVINLNAGGCVIQIEFFAIHRLPQGRVEEAVQKIWAWLEGE